MEMQDTAAVAAVQRMIDDVHNLPTPPLVFTQIVDVVNNPDTSAYDVAAIISEDPAMAAKVLKLTNSAYYGLAGTVTSVKQAIVIIGLNSVKSLVVSASVINMFKSDQIGREFQDRFWRHSLVTAFGSRLLVRENRPTDFGAGELAFTAGLLHDIGKLVMYMHSPNECQKILGHPDTSVSEEMAAERELFGFDHALVGGVLTQAWHIPDSLSRAIANHHRPLHVDDPSRLTDVIHVADGLSYHALAGDTQAVSAPPIDPRVFERVNLKLEHVGDYLEKLRSEYMQAATFLKMARGEA